MNFILINRMVVWLLILAMIALGTVAILGIWEIIPQEDVVIKSFSTSIVVAIVGGVVLASLKFLEEREKERFKK